ncbi:MAG: hypothetical protein JST47_11110 [Bacteroidetes bacterium]|nr:hypothetical protein [Bacteroidota bacterium]MBS1975433.1 hypothetical protein [Bacteroidota bacterium]
MKTLASFVIACLLFAGCKKSTTTPGTGGTGGTDTSAVYTVGYEVINGIPVASYWKNGKATRLSDGTKHAQATGICIANGDVYISGFQIEPGNVYTARYWKNGVETILTDGTTMNNIAYGIAVSGSTVFVVGKHLVPGTNTERTVEWINGTAYPGTVGQQIADASANAIVASNGTFYIVGTDLSKNGVKFASKWTHTLPFVYTDGTLMAPYTDGRGVAVIGNDMYICGTMQDTINKPYNSTARYWQNNTNIGLTDGTNWAEANGICSSGTDIFVCGFERTGGNPLVSNTGIKVAKYWKNKVPFVLGDGKTNSVGRCIAVSGSDVYVGGSLESTGGGTDRAILWKNGVAIYSTANSAIFWGVAVAPHSP